MKRAVLLLMVCCLLFSSCGAKVDFVISRETVSSSLTKRDEDGRIFVLINKNSKKYHLDPNCVYAIAVSESNCLEMKVKNEEYLRDHGYEPCAKCSSEK